MAGVRPAIAPLSEEWSPRPQTALYRIAQEATNNAGKHAQAAGRIDNGGDDCRVDEAVLLGGVGPEGQCDHHDARLNARTPRYI
jgi:hypothetical protein